MAAQVLIPQLGNEISEAEITEWLVKDGEMVATGDLVLTITTTKTAFDIESPADGRLKVLTPEGELVDVGTVVGEII